MDSDAGGTVTAQAILGLDDDMTAQRAKAAGWRTATRAEVGPLVAAWEAGRFHLLTWPADRVAGPPVGRTGEPDRRSAVRRSLPAIEALLDPALANGEATMLALFAPVHLDIANAAHGRASIDQLLAATEDRVRRVADELLAPAVAIARPRGAEIVVAARCTAAVADRAAAAWDAALSAPFATANGEARFGTRIAVVLGEAGDSVATLLGRAEAGVAQQAPPLPSIEALAVDLHHALGRDEIDVLFQPQVETATGRIVGVEALVRWAHPAIGSIGAETLFATAARAGLAVALSDHIQTLALRRAAAWRGAMARLRVSLNLEAADLTRPGFAALFLDRARQSGFPLDRLTVEVTETGLIRDLPSVAAVLAELRAAGCRTAIDDFGTGYSSLGYLQALPLDYLKLDKALVGDIAGCERGRVVLRGVVGIAEGLGLVTIGEGVETEAQRAVLAQFGCPLYQGYLTAGPLDEAALARMTETSR